MFFSNLMMYRITQDIDFNTDALELALQTKRTREPASQELATYGFMAPLGKSEDAPLVHESFGFTMIATKHVERIMPGSVVRDELKAKVESIEASQLRKVYKKEREQLKDELIQTLLPRAFIKRKVTFAAIDKQRGLIFINSSSPRTAEDLLSTLREVIGALPVRPVSVKFAPSAAMTEWLKTKKAPDQFFVLDECDLIDAHEDGGTAKLKRQDLTGDETQLHLSTGKVTSKLSMAWQDKLSFMLDDKLGIKRIKFEDLLQDQAEADGGEDAAGQFDASFVLMMMTFREFIPALIEALGGEEIPQGLGSDVLPADKPERKRVVNEVQLDAFEEQPPETGAAEEQSPLNLTEEELYPLAVAWVIAEGRASISGVQRNFKVAYNRAARALERMEKDMVISMMGTDGKRTVLMESFKEFAQ